MSDGETPGPAVGQPELCAPAPGAGRAPRIGVMGGTFDPIHHGHLVAASEVAHFFSLDEVVFVPTGQPWQKDGRKVAPSEDRYLMTVIATASNPRFSVSRVDIDRPGPTYTIDTLRELRAPARRGGGVVLHYRRRRAVPDDVLAGRGRAVQAGALRRLHPARAPADQLRGCRSDEVSLVEIPALAISSTECRDRVAAGEPVWYLVPDGVVQYIAKRRLYCADPGVARGG